MYKAGTNRKMRVFHLRDVDQYLFFNVSSLSVSGVETLNFSVEVVPIIGIAKTLWIRDFLITKAATTVVIQNLDLARMLQGRL